MGFSNLSRGITYLDNASTTFPKPKNVLDPMLDFYSKYGVNPGRSGYDLCLAAGEIVQKTRNRLTQFFGGTNPDHLIFTYNATEALNTIIQGILEEGDHAISTTIEHNSVIRPLNHMKANKKIEIDYVPVGKDGRVDPGDIASCFRKNTKLVVVNHGSNVIGTVQPVAEIGKLCRKRGIYFAIDTAQTAGAFPIDMEEMFIDALAFTGHKSLLGPMGIGGAYIREGVVIHATRFGGIGVRSSDPLHPEEFPYRLEAGTGNLLGIAGLYFAQEYIEERGIENIYLHEMKLFTRLQQGLSGIERVTLIGTTSLENRLPVLSFNVEGLDPADVGMMLDVDYNIATRAGLHCAPLIHEQLGTVPRGTVRMSIGPMNDEKDVQIAIDAVAQISMDAVK